MARGPLYPRPDVRIDVGGEADIEVLAGAVARPPDEIRWRFFDPAGREHESTVFVLRESGEAPAFASVRECEFLVDGERVSGGVVSTLGLSGTLDRPERLQALLERCLSRLDERGRRLAALSVPTEWAPELGRGGFQRLFEASARNAYLGLDGISPRLARLPLGTSVRRLAERTRRIRPKLVEFEVDSKALSGIAGILAERSPSFALVKDTPWLEWRYLRQPNVTHRLLQYRSKAGQGISSFALVRVGEDEKGRTTIFLEDHWSRGTDRRTFAKLFGELAMWGLAEHADVLRASAAGGSAAEQTLLAAGCIRKKLERVVMARWVGSGGPVLGDRFDARDVELRGGDGELGF